jgi:hypothetical protein
MLTSPVQRFGHSSLPILDPFHSALDPVPEFIAGEMHVNHAASPMHFLSAADGVPGDELLQVP